MLGAMAYQKLVKWDERNTGEYKKTASCVVNLHCVCHSGSRESEQEIPSVATQVAKVARPPATVDSGNIVCNT